MNKKQIFGFIDNTELDKLNPTEKANYQEHLKNYRDLKSIISTAKNEGRKDVNFQIAKEMKANGEPTDKIIRYTKLTKEEIEKL